MRCVNDCGRLATDSKTELCNDPACPQPRPWPAYQGRKEEESYRRAMLEVYSRENIIGALSTIEKKLDTILEEKSKNNKPEKS